MMREANVIQKPPPSAKGHRTWSTRTSGELLQVGLLQRKLTHSRGQAGHCRSTCRWLLWLPRRCCNTGSQRHMPREPRTALRGFFACLQAWTFKVKTRAFSHTVLCLLFFGRFCFGSPTTSLFSRPSLTLRWFLLNCVVFDGFAPWY